MTSFALSSVPPGPGAQGVCIPFTNRQFSGFSPPDESLTLAPCPAAGMASADGSRPEHAPWHRGC